MIDGAPNLGYVSCHAATEKTTALAKAAVSCHALSHGGYVLARNHANPIRRAAGNIHTFTGCTIFRSHTTQKTAPKSRFGVTNSLCCSLPAREKFSITVQS